MNCRDVSHDIVKGLLLVAWLQYFEQFINLIACAIIVPGYWHKMIHG